MEIDKFENKYLISLDSCWLWVEWVDKDGYGKVRDGKSKKPAHRVSYELYRESIPVGMVIDHLCLQKSCVNPWHLEVVSIAENNRRRPYTILCEHGVGRSRCEYLSCRSISQKIYDSRRKRRN